MGNLNKNLETISLSQKYATRLLFIWFFSATILILYFTLYLLFVFFSLLYSSSSFFFILILCLILFIFFSDMCHSRCCSSLVGQSSIPLSSSFLEVMMNKDFWGFLFYSDKLSVALNATASGWLLWIYQEDLEGFLGCYVYLGMMSLIVQPSSNIVHISVGCLLYFVYEHLSRMVQVLHSFLDWWWWALFGRFLGFGILRVLLMISHFIFYPCSRVFFSIVGLHFLERSTLGFSWSKAQCLLKF